MYIFGSLHEARNVTIISATILIPSRSRRNSFPRELKLTSIFLIDSRDFSPRFILIIMTKEEGAFPLVKNQSIYLALRTSASREAR